MEKIFGIITKVNDINLREEDLLKFHVEESTEPDLSMRELLEALKKMKNGKASGMDQVPAELFKNMGDVGSEWLLELLFRLWDSQAVPEDWSKDLMCPVFKKGDKTECSNYRGMSLMSHALKVYERILEKRLRIPLPFWR